MRPICVIPSIRADSVPQGAARTRLVDSRIKASRVTAQRLTGSGRKQSSVVGYRSRPDSARNLSAGPPNTIDFTRQFWDCGSSIATLASGVALTSTGALSGFGVLVSVSGALGMSACAAGLFGKSLAVITDTPSKEIDDAVSFVSIGGVLSIMYGDAADLDSDELQNIANIATSIERVLIGVAGLRTASRGRDLAAGLADMSTGSYDFGEAVERAFSDTSESHDDRVGEPRFRGDSDGSDSDDSGFNDYWDSIFDRWDSYDD